MQCIIGKKNNGAASVYYRKHSYNLQKSRKAHFILDAYYKNLVLSQKPQSQAVVVKTTTTTNQISNSSTIISF
jgi:ribosomal protein S12